MLHLSLDSTMKRQQTVQELRARLDEGEEAITDELFENVELERDMIQAELYILGVERWHYLWSSPWDEFTDPEWVSPKMVCDQQGWWLPWAECG